MNIAVQISIVVRFIPVQRVSFAQDHALDRPPMHQKHLGGEIPPTHDIVNLVAFEAELPHGAEESRADPWAEALFPQIDRGAVWLEGWKSAPSLPLAAATTLLPPQELSNSVVLDQSDIPSSDVVDQAVEVVIDKHERDHGGIFHALDDHEVEFSGKPIERRSKLFARAGRFHGRLIK